MNSLADRKYFSNVLLGLLLGIAIAGSTVVGPNRWVGAALSGLGFVGALIVLCRQGALKARYIVLLAVAVLAAAFAGWLMQ